MPISIRWKSYKSYFVWTLICNYSGFSIQKLTNIFYFYFYFEAKKRES